MSFIDRQRAEWLASRDADEYFERLAEERDGYRRDPEFDMVQGPLPEGAGPVEGEQYTYTVDPEPNARGERGDWLIWGERGQLVARLAPETAQAIYGPDLEPRASDPAELPSYAPAVAPFKLPDDDDIPF